MSETPNNGRSSAYQPADEPQGPRYFINPVQNQPVPNAFQTQPQGRVPAFQQPQATPVQPRPIQPSQSQGKVKKGFPVFGIAALVVLAVMLTVFAVTAVISMQKYNLMKGMSGSPFVGLNNYERVFSMVETPRTLGATVEMRLFEGLFSLVVAAAFCALYYAVKKPGAALLMGGLWLIPVCIPPLSMALLLTQTLGLRLTSHEAGVAGYALATFLQTAGLFCFSGGLFTALNLMKKGRVGKGPYFGLLIAVLVWLLAGLSVDRDAALSMSSQMTRPGSLDQLIYEHTVMRSQFSVSAATSVIKVLLQIAIAIVPMVVLCILARKKSTKGKLPLMVLWVFAGFLTMGLILILLSVFGVRINGAPVGSGVLNSLIVSVMGGSLGGLIAYSFVHLMRRAASLLYGLIAMVLAAAMSCLVGQYLMIKTLSLVDTLWPAVFFAAFDPRLILLASVLAFALRDHMERRPGSLVLALALLCAAFTWGSMMQPLIYIRGNAQYTLPLYLRQVALNAVSISTGDANQSMAQVYGEQMNIKLGLQLLTALPPLVLGVGGALLMKRAFNPFSQTVKG